jgi:hypothetical protein
MGSIAPFNLLNDSNLKAPVQSRSAVNVFRGNDKA